MQSQTDALLSVRYLEQYLWNSITNPIIVGLIQDGKGVTWLETTTIITAEAKRFDFVALRGEHVGLKRWPAVCCSVPRGEKRKKITWNMVSIRLTARWDAEPTTMVGLTASSNHRFKSFGPSTNSMSIIVLTLQSINNRFSSPLVPTKNSSRVLVLNLF